MMEDTGDENANMKKQKSKKLHMPSSARLITRE
jgi:hypothetical protein